VKSSFGVRRFVPILVLVALVLPMLASTSAPAQGAGSGDAIDYVKDEAEKLGVTRADVADVSVTSKYTSSHRGITHVNLNQRYRASRSSGDTRR